MITIALADDHEVLRKGIVASLSQQPDMRVVAEIGDPVDLDAKLYVEHPSILLLDISMPGFNAVGAVRRLKQKFPALHILIVSAYHNPEYVISLTDAGVDGYWLKSEPLKLLPVAIRSVMQDEPWFSQPIGNILAQQQKSKRLVTELTEREVEVLRAIASGLSSDEIGAKLFISRRTVQSHLRNIMAKLDSTTRTEALTKAVQRGFIDPVLLNRAGARKSEGKS